MHKYRRAAKYAAWYDDPNDQSDNHFPVRNPFAKWRPNAQHDNVRSMEDGDGLGLRPVQTDADYRLTSPIDRRTEMGADAHIRHAATSPTGDNVRHWNPGKHSTEDEIVEPGTSNPDRAIDDITEKPEYSGTSSEKYPNGNIADDKVRHRDTSTTTDTKGKRSLRSFLGRKSTDASGEGGDDDDNNNGKNKKQFTAMSQIRATVFNSWINLLLIFSPVGIAVNYAGINPVAVFVINFIAIIPLAAMLSYATEEIALRTGEVLGGLLNASFGNAVELIVSIIALAKDQVLIVQTSLIGSMLSNLLLVMGMAFFFGGINRTEQAFNITVAQTAASLLFLAVSSLIIPTAFEQWARTSDGTSTTTDTTANPKPGVAPLSRGTAILLLLVYGCYLFFQLKTHTKMYNAPSEKNQTKDVGARFKNAVIPERLRRRTVDERAAAAAESSPEAAGGAANDEPEEPQLSVWVAVLTLAVSTVLVALNAEYLVDSINAITCGGGISKNFVGLILLPIVGNAAEHATAVTVAVKDKMDLAIGVAVGSSMQIALLVLPLIVVLGWIIGKDDMTLFFDGFQIAVLFVAVILVNYLIQDGKSHWLEGVLLFILYVIIAVAAWFYPTAPGLSDCPGDSGAK